MSNDDFMDDLLDATMKKIYDTFGKPKSQPGADENPPRNYRCGKCGRWTEASHDCE